jgi:hypothetical protein
MAENKSAKATEEQLEYAALLNIGMKVGMLMLLVTFAMYVFGIASPQVPVEKLPHYWTMSVSEYTTEAGVKTGWGWLYSIGRGDFMNFIGIAFLSGVTIVCYLRIIPTLLKKGDRVYAVLALMEVLILVLAASGILKSGH